MRKQQEKRDRLAAYVKSRPALLEADATREAQKSVDSDARIDATGRKAVLERCASECRTLNPPPTQEARTCVEGCAAKDDAVKRLDRCVNVDWLGAPARN